MILGLEKLHILRLLRMCMYTLTMVKDQRVLKVIVGFIDILIWRCSTKDWRKILLYWYSFGTEELIGQEDGERWCGDVEAARDFTHRSLKKTDRFSSLSCFFHSLSRCLSRVCIWQFQEWPSILTFSFCPNDQAILAWHSSTRGVYPQINPTPRSGGLGVLILLSITLHSTSHPS